MSSNTSSIENPDKLSPAQRWNAEITAAEKELSKFTDRAKYVTKQFLDEREALQADQRWFNIFYANTNILESAIYATLPKPTVSRRFTDYNDDVSRVAALIIERSITQDLDDPTDTFDPMMRHCVQDRLVPGLAQAWLRLETDTEEIEVPPTPGNDVYGPDDQEETAASPQTIKKITNQRVCVDYIFWGDFLWSPCRVWEERRWVGRKAYMTRDELVERFGQEKGARCPLDFSINGTVSVTPTGSTPKEDVMKKAVVYEIWDRLEKKVVWYNKGMQELLDERVDPLGLTGFEPCPVPMLANISTSNTTPRPDYYMLQDQYSELNTVNNRISMLIAACKVVGVYDKSTPGIARMLKEGFDNQLIPVDNWAMFAEKGGIKGQIDWLPLEVIVQALRELNAAREVIKGQIYELTGIADIVRGASKASETLGAQQIKAQFASVRIKKLQDEVARFASNVMRIKAEIMVKHFEPEILLRKSNIAVTGNDQYIAPAMELLQSEESFEWRIQITADTMSQADYASEKQDRIDFMTAVSKFMAQVGPMLEAAPEAAPLLIGLLKWTVAGFRGARDIEGMLDQAVDALGRQPQQPQPDPAAEKARAEQDQAQQQFQLEMQSKQADMQAAQQKNQLEQQRLMFEMQAEQQRLQLEAQAEQQRIQMEQQRMQMELMFEELMNKLQLQSAQQLADVKLETANAQAKVSTS